MGGGNGLGLWQSWGRAAVPGCAGERCYNNIVSADEAVDGQPQEAGTTALGRRLISNALRYRPAKADDTKWLAPMRHDADLLPLVTSQLRALLSGLHRDTHVEYDIQGMRDEGTDVLVRLTAANAAVFVCLQVKSHIELAKEEQVNNLRLQQSRSDDHYGENITYLICLAGDMTDTKIKTRVRSVHAAFAKKQRVQVIDPYYLATFLRLSQAQLDSLITLTVRVGDPLLTDARAELARQEPLVAGVLLRLVADSVAEPGLGSDPETLQSDVWLAELARRTPLASLYLAEAEEAALASHAVAGTPPPEEEDEYGEEEEDEYEEYDEAYDDEVDVTDLTPTQLGAMLAPLPDDGAGLPGDGHEPTAILQALEELVEQGEVVVVDGRYLASVSESPALYALAAESRVKHDSSRDEVIEHLISTVLTED
jgi:hypothetical protein